MSNNNQDFNTQDESINQAEQIQRLVYRLLPFWPYIILAIAFGILGARIYLRYQVPVYVATARLAVNDETQQKSANLNEIFKFEYKNAANETEREIQILRSSDLLRKLAIQMQLNISYLGQGRIRNAQFYDEIPFRLELQNPESIKSAIAGEAEMIGDKIRFNGVLYPMDSMVTSSFGIIRWSINKNYAENIKVDKIFISIQPINSAVGRLKGGLDVAPISKTSSILDITFSDAIPSRAVAILDNLIKLYGSSTVDYKGRIYENTQKFLDSRLRLISDELSGVEKNLQAYKSSEGIIDLGKEGELYLSTLKGADAKIGEINVQLDVLKQIEQYAAGRNNTNSPIPATLGITDLVLNGLLNQLYQTEFELEKTRQVSGTKNPQIPVYEELIAKLKPSILTSINNLRIGLDASRKRLQSDNNQLAANLNKIPLKERVLLDISRQQGIKNAIYTFLLQKREESAIAAASIVPNYRLIEKPEPGGLVYPVPKKNYSIGILTALFIVVLFIYLKEFSGRRILFRSQIENMLKLPVISELIFQEHENDSPIVVGAGKRTLIAEQFRELRTNINYITANSKDKCKVILMTSSIPKEGKSFVAINTAISISLTGDKVVLLEFDLRKPKISKPLGMSKEIGLSNYLIGKVNEVDIIQTHPSIENLSVISSGPLPPNPAELLSSPKLIELINYLKEYFDFIIIDSPPIAAVTDAKILAGIADATIYIIRHNFTNYAFLNLIRDIHQKNGMPNINLVFNGILNKKILGYGYGRGYGYGYGYSYGYGYGYGYTEESKRIPWWKKLFKSLFNKKKA